MTRNSAGMGYCAEQGRQPPQVETFYDEATGAAVQRAVERRKVRRSR